MPQLLKWLPMALCLAVLIALSAPAALAVPALQLYGGNAAADLDSGTSSAAIGTLGLNTRIPGPQVGANARPAGIGDTGFRRGRSNLRRWYNNPTNDVPEPGTLWLLGVGVAGIALASRRARKQ